MKKVGLALVFAIVLNLPAQGVTCFRCLCDYAVNGDFSNSSTWTFSDCGSGAYCGTVQQTDPCGFYTWMAHISYPGTKVTMQQVTFPVDAGPVFSIEFSVIAYSIPGTWYDELRVYVKDVSTGVLEYVGSVHGNQLTKGCQRFAFQPSKNYAGKTVELQFVTGSLSAITWYLDRVTFWEGSYC
jgi:hypothetical protein